VEIDIVALVIFTAFTLIGLVHGSVVQGTKLLALAMVLLVGIPGAAAIARYLHESKGTHETIALVGSLAVINGALYVGGYLAGVLLRRKLYPEGQHGNLNRFLGGVFGMAEGAAFAYMGLAVVSVFPGAMIDIGGRPLSQARRESKIYSELYVASAMPKMPLAARLQAVERVSTLTDDIQQLETEIAKAQAATGEADPTAVERAEPEALKALIGTLEEEVPEVAAITEDEEVRGRVTGLLRRGKVFSMMKIPEVRTLLEDEATQEKILAVLSRERDLKRKVLDEARKAKRPGTMR
jgi:uncharacterized membrane protein required for colicin V production